MTWVDKSALLSVQDVPALAPLDYSHEADDTEAELKALFMELFETYIRPTERFINLAGAPHLGTFELVEAAVKAEGLAILRRTDEAPLRYLYKAWRGRNQKRGLTMLKAYLQLLWPGGWTADQMWCRTEVEYPLRLSTTQGAATDFLTSRVNVSIGTDVSEASNSDLATTAASLRSVIPARILLNVSVTAEYDVEGMAVYAGATHTLVHNFNAACV